MGDNHSIRCVTCCAAATGGDPQRIDPVRWIPFIGGIESPDRVRSYEAEEAVRLAPRLKAVSIAVLALLDHIKSREVPPDAFWWRGVDVDITVSPQGARLDYNFFAEHGDHELAVMVGGMQDVNACTDCWWPTGGVEFGVVRPRGHAGQHGRRGSDV